MRRSSWVWLVLLGGVSGVLAAQNVPDPGGSQAGSAPTLPQVIEDVHPWETVPPEQGGLRKLSREEVVAGVNKWIEAFKTLTPWEATYQATYKQGSPSEFLEEFHVRIVSDGRKWYLNAQIKHSGEQQTNVLQAASDGNVVRAVGPDQKDAQIRGTHEGIGLGSAATLPVFLSQLPAEGVLRRGADFYQDLDAGDPLNDPQTQLSPAYARLDGHVCYVLERVKRQEYPVFKNHEQPDQWLREHPDERASRDGSTQPILLIDPQAEASQKINRTSTTCLAVDPNLGFAVVRWARGDETQIPRLRTAVFPKTEVAYRDFRKVNGNLYVPFQMEFTEYKVTSGAARNVHFQSRLALEEFLIGREYKTELFQPVFPEGCGVLDTIRGIWYKVGDPKDKMDRLLAAADAQDAFYRRLRQEPAPALEASKWIGTDPIDLAQYKGRSIILHFWSIGCRPCVYELPRLQTQYGDTLKSSEGPLFISIHQYVDGPTLKEVEQTIKEKGITFPVMIDASHTDRMYWGQTSFKYRVFSNPYEIRIGEDGRVGEIEKHTVSESSWWIDHAGDSQSLSMKPLPHIRRSRSQPGLVPIPSGWNRPCQGRKKEESVN